ncbi:MAG: nucleotidyltransferase domain-containing protein [Cyclobacteriaceae bacterium]
MLKQTYISKHTAAIVQLCSDYGVNRLYAFGSVVTDKFDPVTSDIDLLVTMDVMSPMDRGENLIGLWDSLELLFDKKVDLLTDESLKNPVLSSSIKENKVLIYDRSGKEVSV